MSDYVANPEMNCYRIRAYRMGLKTGRRNDKNSYGAARARWQRRHSNTLIIHAHADWDDGWQQGQYERSLA